jgi:hypothetical protein
VFSSKRAEAGAQVGAVVRWYVEIHAPRVPPVPFYCDPNRVGAFAVGLDDLAVGADDAVFRVFVTLAMYQALRDIVVMRRQRSLTRRAVRVVVDARFLKRAIRHHQCSALRSERFEDMCDVTKNGSGVDCARSAGAPCHVKDATLAFNRMGDMGKLPTSAWLRLWRSGGISAVVAEVCRGETSPVKRADVLVERFATVHRVGRKLATMSVSALSVPALAPGLTPWFPEIDGSALVVVDTNVARAVDTLRGTGTRKTYDARSHWVRAQAARLDLRAFRSDLPRESARFVQEALYSFCSRSNRIAQRDPCAQREEACTGCVPALCPFTTRA